MNFINNDIIELIIRKNNNTKKSVITLINLSIPALGKFLAYLKYRRVNFLSEHRKKSQK